MLFCRRIHIHRILRSNFISGKEIRFGWYYGDIGIRLTENAIGKMTDADKYQTVTYIQKISSKTLTSQFN